jgi:hypothetical protein
MLAWILNIDFAGGGTPAAATPAPEGSFWFPFLSRWPLLLMALMWRE